MSNQIECLNFKKGALVGLVSGLITALLVFGLCIWGSTLPAATDVSLTWSVRPWWRLNNWLMAFSAFVTIGLFFGILATFRPDLKRKK
jgi:hypothetical protein